MVYARKDFQDIGSNRRIEILMREADAAMWRRRQVHSLKLFLTDACVNKGTMTQDTQKDIKNAGQNLEAKAETAKDRAEGKPSSETLNRAEVKAKDAVEDAKRDL